MKLEQLYIGDYRVLHSLTLHFERSLPNASHFTFRNTYALDFLAGVNGTGKTTALQFIGQLFTRLYTTDYFPEPFSLTYKVGNSGGSAGRFVTVSNLHEGGEAVRDGSFKFRYTADGGEEFSGKLPPDLLPKYVVIYTTGSEDEWQRVLEADPGSGAEVDGMPPGESQDAAELPGHRPDMRAFDDEQQPGPTDGKLLFIRAAHLPLVALCGLIAAQWEADKVSDALAGVLEDIQLQPLSAFSLRIRAHQDLTAPYQMAVIDMFVEAADQVIRRGGDLLLIFDMQAQQSRRQNEDASIFTLQATPIDLFRDLYKLYLHQPFYDPPLQEVNLFFRRSNNSANASSSSAPDGEAGGASAEPMLLTYDWLSDGERSFLARMALFALFRADDLLILLDEPEVHFNDVWKREIVEKLDNIMAGYASHAVITTHSSIALSDVPAEDILVLRRTGAHTSGGEHSPGIATFGADPSDILVHVFGTRSPNGEHSRNFIRREIGERRTAQELSALSEVVAPGYWRYRIQLEAQSVQGRLQ